MPATSTQKLPIANVFEDETGISLGLIGYSSTLADISTGVTVTAISNDDITFTPVTTSDPTYATSTALSGQYLVFAVNADGTVEERLAQPAQTLVDLIQANLPAATPLSDTFYYQLSNGAVDQVTYNLNDVEINTSGAPYHSTLYVAPFSSTTIPGLVIDTALADGQSTDADQLLTVNISLINLPTNQSNGTLSLDPAYVTGGTTITTVTAGQIHSVTIAGTVAQIDATLQGLTYNSPASGNDGIFVQVTDGPSTTGDFLVGKVTTAAVTVQNSYTFHFPVAPLPQNTFNGNLLDTGFGVTITGISTNGVVFTPVTSTDPNYGTSPIVDGQYLSFSANADGTAQFGLTQNDQAEIDAIQANEDVAATTPLSDTFYYQYSSGGSTLIDQVTVDLNDVVFTTNGAPYTTPLDVAADIATNIAGLVVDKALTTTQSTDADEVLSVTVTVIDQVTGVSDGALTITSGDEGIGAGGTIVTNIVPYGVNSVTITGSISQINADLQGLTYNSAPSGNDTIEVSAVDGPSTTATSIIGQITTTAPVALQNAYAASFGVSPGLYGTSGGLNDISSSTTLIGISTDDIHFTAVTSTDPTYANSAAVTGNYLTFKANADGTAQEVVTPDSQTLIDEIQGNQGASTPLSDTFYYEYKTANGIFVDQVAFNLNDVLFTASGAAYTNTLTVSQGSSTNIPGLVVHKALATGQTTDQNEALKVSVSVFDFATQTNAGTLTLDVGKEGNGAGGTTTASGNAVTIVGSIAQIDADLQGLVYNSAGHLGDDAIIIQAVDGPATTAGLILGDIQTPCFCRGTHIETDRGDVRVEDLMIGDRLVTRSGQARRLIWIGKRQFDRAQHPISRDVLPILIRAGALDTDVPRSDLFVSPLHALYLDSVLIPAQALVNGATIIQLTDVAQVEYFHLELATHDVIYAEGAEAESYLNDNNRDMFANAADFAWLYPDAVPAPLRYCAPRLPHGPVVDGVHARLTRRAAALGYTPTRAHIVLVTELGRNCATIAPGVSELHLRSSTRIVPGDARPLGALVVDVTLDGRALPLSDARLCRGFHVGETHGARTVRWTDGNGVIALDPATTERRLEIEIGAVVALEPA